MKTCAANSNETLNSPHFFHALTGGRKQSWDRRAFLARRYARPYGGRQSLPL